MVWEWLAQNGTGFVIRVDVIMDWKVHKRILMYYSKPGLTYLNFFIFQQSYDHKHTLKSELQNLKG